MVPFSTITRRLVARLTRATAQPPAGLVATPAPEPEPAAADITLTGQRRTLTYRMFDSAGHTYRLDEELDARAAVHHASPAEEEAAEANSVRDQLDRAIWQLKDVIGWERCDEMASMLNGYAYHLHNVFSARAYDLARMFTVDSAPVGVVIFTDKGPALDATLR